MRPPKGIGRTGSYIAPGARKKQRKSSSYTGECMVGKRQGRDLTYLSPLGLEMLLASFGTHTLFPEKLFYFRHDNPKMQTENCS